MEKAQVEISRAARKIAILERPVDGQYLRRLQRLAKSAHGLSARQVAEQFRVSRSTFKAWQGGSKSIPEHHAGRARRLYVEWSGDVKAERARTRDVLVLVFARGCDKRMRRLKICRAPRVCVACGEWFVPRDGRNKKCCECR